MGFAYLIRGRNEENISILAGVTFPHAHALRAGFFPFPPLRRLPRRLKLTSLSQAIISLKARLHRRFLSQQLDAIFVAPKLHQVSNMFETPAISRRQITVKNRTWFTRAILKLQLWARQKLHRVAVTKIACVNGPLDWLSKLAPLCHPIRTEEFSRALASEFELN